MLKAYSDLMADVRYDNRLHSIRSLVQPNDPVVKQVADILNGAPDFIAAAQDFVDSFTKYGREPGDFWSIPDESLSHQLTRFRADCVTGDTPVWVKIHNKLKIIEVRELLPEGDYAVFGGVDILTPSGFAPLTAITRKEKKPTIKLLTTSAIGLTPGHKALVSPGIHGDGRYSPVKDVRFDQLLRFYPEWENTNEGDYESGWAYGLFFSDGSAGLGTRGSGGFWRIVNANTDFLERSAVAFARIFPSMRFFIKSFHSYRFLKKTNFGFRGHGLACLDAGLLIDSNIGLRDEFINLFRGQFYNSYGARKVPDFIYSYNSDFLRGFYDGAYAGDGKKIGDRLTSKNKMSTLGLSSILVKLGTVPYISPDHNAFGIARHDKLFEGKNWRVNGEEEETFDLTTGNGEFVAGDIGVKNCDCKSILLCSILRNYIPASKVFCAIGKHRDVTSEEGHMWVITENPDGSERLVEATAPSSMRPSGLYRAYALFNDQHSLSSLEGLDEFGLFPLEFLRQEPAIV